MGEASDRAHEESDLAAVEAEQLVGPQLVEPLGDRQQNEPERTDRDRLRLARLRTLLSFSFAVSLSVDRFAFCLRRGRLVCSLLLLAAVLLQYCKLQPSQEEMSI